MKRWTVIMAAGALALSASAVAQDIWVQPYATFWGMQNDISDPSSEFSWSFVNGELIFQDTSTDCQVPGFPEWYVPCGWANKHVWYITLDGVAPATFDPDTTGEFIEFEATVEMLPPTPLMNADRTVEAGLFLLERPVPRYPRDVNNQGFWWADGLFMVANESAGGIGGEVAAFGGRMPFWAGGGVRYTGGPITLVFRYDGRRALEDGRVQYEIRYQGQTTTSPWLVTGDAASSYNNGPHGLRMFRLGGYLQINIDGDGTAPRRTNAGIGGRVKWTNIKLTRNGVTKQVVGANRGDVNRDGCVDDADLLTVLFNFGTGCGN